MSKGEARKAVKLGPLRRVLDSATGARLCFGEPVVHGDRTVIAVARVRGTGGWGFGHNAEGDGGGGGGWLDATPAGFIEITAAGTRFERIAPDRLPQALKATTALAAIAALVYRR